MRTLVTAAPGMPVLTEALQVEVVEGEIVLVTRAFPCLTPLAARMTGERLLAAARKVDGG